MIRPIIITMFFILRKKVKVEVLVIGAWNSINSSRKLLYLILIRCLLERIMRACHKPNSNLNSNCQWKLTSSYLPAIAMKICFNIRYLKIKDGPQKPLNLINTWYLILYRINRDNSILLQVALRASQISSIQCKTIRCPSWISSNNNSSWWSQIMGRNNRCIMRMYRWCLSMLLPLLDSILLSNNINHSSTSRMHYPSINSINWIKEYSILPTLTLLVLGES